MSGTGTSELTVHGRLRQLSGLSDLTPCRLGLLENAQERRGLLLRSPESEESDGPNMSSIEGGGTGGTDGKNSGARVRRRILKRESG